MVQLPDGTMEKRMKLPLNADPGVHSSLALDQLAGTMHPVATLPTITESKNGSPTEEDNPIEMKRPDRQRSRNSESDANDLNVNNNIPRNASQPAFASKQEGE